MHALLGLDRMRDANWGLISIEWLWETVAHATDTKAILVNIMGELPKGFDFYRVRLHGSTGQVPIFATICVSFLDQLGGFDTETNQSFTRLSIQINTDRFVLWARAIIAFTPSATE
jgi:hypothetical protein